MTDNRTTELLCKLLDERGADWRIEFDGAIEWESAAGDYSSAVDVGDGKLVFTGCLTPEQAIAATLGVGECEIVYHYEARTRSEIGRERVELSCGHIVERHSKYCQECGRKIRKAAKR